ncbi:uncharacterized protein [Ambystoma mexicanum]|uniref:uncharacterized protein n=1 Tax=Ambystoma mexicanum TaxID=8296 RepID=UPI0037E8D5DA
MVFEKNANKNTKQLNWHLENAKLEVVDKFKYLGVTLDGSSCDKAIQDQLWHKVKRLTAQTRLVDKKIGKFSIVPAIKFYKAKVVPSIIYGMEAAFNLPNSIWQKLEGHVWKAVLGLLKSTSMPAIGRELGLVSLASSVEQSKLRLYRKIIMADSLPIFAVISEELKMGTCKALNNWAVTIQETLNEISCTEKDLKTTPDRVKIKIELMDSIRTVDTARVNKLLTHLPPTFNRVKEPLNYCKKFPNKKMRSTFLKARLNLLMTHQILALRSSKMDNSCRLCKNKEEVESLQHLVLKCPKTSTNRDRYLQSCLQGVMKLDEEAVWNRLISGETTRWTIAAVKLIDLAFEMISNTQAHMKTAEGARPVKSPIVI